MCSIRDFFPVEYRVGGTRPKKNYILENRKYITKLAKTTQVAKENQNPSNKLSCPKKQKLGSQYKKSKDLVAENLEKQDKIIDLDKIDASIKSIRSALAQTKITQKTLGIKLHQKLPLAFRDQATQTINPFNEEDILKDSIIRYSNLKQSDISKNIQMKHMNTIAIQTETSESENFNLADIKKLKCFQNKNNINSKTKQPRLTALKEKSISHQKIGEIPKYLKDRKALQDKNEKELQKKLAIRHELGLDDPTCPPGHILLPEPERLEHLASIKKEYNGLIQQMNMLPVGSDSFMMKEKRKHIEEELNKLQLGIKLFSRKKLYVKANPKTINSYK